MNGVAIGIASGSALLLSHLDVYTFLMGHVLSTDLIVTRIKLAYFNVVVEGSAPS